MFNPKYFSIVCRLSDMLIDKVGAELLPELRHQLLDSEEDKYDIVFETEIISYKTKDHAWWKLYRYGLRINFDRKCYVLVNLDTRKELYFYNNQSLFAFFADKQNG